MIGKNEKKGFHSVWEKASKKMETGNVVIVDNNQENSGKK